MRELCCFSLDQWETKIHLIWRNVSILLIGQEACRSMQDSKTLKIILIPKQYWTWFDWNGWTWRQAGVLERDRPIKLQDWREISYCWLRHVISIGIPLEILSVTWGLPQFCRFSDSDGRGWHSTFGGEVEQPGGREGNQWGCCLGLARASATLPPSHQPNPP